jgi:hypothetical protein
MINQRRTWIGLQLGSEVGQFPDQEEECGSQRFAAAFAYLIPREGQVYGGR